MQKIMSLAIAVVVGLFAIGTFATATTSPQRQIEFSGERINALQLMSSSKDLPAQQYEAF